MANQQDTEEPWAAPRDASWYDNPDVRTDKVTHVAGRKVREGHMSRCGRSILDDSLSRSLAEWSEASRCRSNGCRQAWAAAPTT